VSFVEQFPHVAGAILREAGWHSAQLRRTGEPHLTVWYPPPGHGILGMTLAEAWHVYTAPVFLRASEAAGTTGPCTITITSGENQ
jgi:hypothetical protein